MAAAATTPVGRKRVLGVEPDPVTRALVALYLEPHGYHVQLAASVDEALESLPSAEAVAFLCSEAGLEPAALPERERLRQAVGALPVVALLEPGAPAALTRHWKGVREHLTKPLSPVALLAVLQGKAFRAGGEVPAGAASPTDGDGLLAGFQGLVAEMEMDAALARELALSFLQRAPAYLGELDEALSAGDLERADRAAHTMKGMCGNLRFGPMVAASERIRAAARQGDPESARRELAGLESAYEELSAALEAHWTAQD